MTQKKPDLWWLGLLLTLPLLEIILLRVLYFSIRSNQQEAGLFVELFLLHVPLELLLRILLSRKQKRG